MAAAGGVGRHEDVAGADDESLVVASVNSSVPASVTTYCGSGASCQSKLECGGDSLKCTAMTSVRRSSVRPSSTCEALFLPVYSLNACIASPLYGRASARPGGLQLCELAALAQCLNGGIDGIGEIGALLGIGDPELFMGRNLHRDREFWSLAREP